MLPSNWTCFVINLDRSTYRLRSISRQLAKSGIAFQRFEAVDGSVLDPNCHPAFNRQRYEQRHGKEPVANEIGCFMSHIGVMEAFLKSGAERCLVLEDDALIDASLAGVLHELEDAADAWDMTLLYGNHFGAPLRQRPLGMNHHLVGFFFRQTGAVAYAINRKAAEAYLAHLLPMTLPIDVDYDRAWDFSIRFRGVLPFPVKTGRHPSEIGKTGRKFAWYRRFATYLNRMNHGARRLLHYAFTDPIWLTALKLRLAPSKRRAEGNETLPQATASLSPAFPQLKKARS